MAREKSASIYFYFFGIVIFSRSMKGKKEGKIIYKSSED